MKPKSTPVPKGKPLAGTCRHQWENQESPFVLAQLCKVCKLFRYKSALRADWEYRAPIPMGKLTDD